jgi:hypothetical protein
MPKWLRQKMGRRVLVTTIRDTTVEGVLVRDYADGVVLLGAELHQAHGDPQQLAGEFFVPRAEVAFIQHEG